MIDETCARLSPQVEVWLRSDMMTDSALYQAPSLDRKRSVGPLSGTSMLISAVSLTPESAAPLVHAILRAKYRPQRQRQERERVHLHLHLHRQRSCEAS